MDRVTRKKRSEIMSKVGGKDTRIEVKLRSDLHKRGFRFRKNVAALPGKPDIVLPKYKTVIFVHGCFWHQHKGCSKSGRPKSNVEFWNEKLDKNMERDAKSTLLLKNMGWKVLTVWECELNNENYLLDPLIRQIKK